MKKKLLSCMIAAFIACSGFAAVPVSADDSNSNYGNTNYGNSSYGSDYGSSDYGKSYKMTRVGKAKRTVTVKKTFKLEVDKKGDALKDNHLKWSIKNKKIVKFVSKDRTDDDVKLKALKPGTTKVICYSKKTGKKIVYTITVKKKAKAVSNNSDYGNSNYGNSSYGNSSYGNSGYGL